MKNISLKKIGSDIRFWIIVTFFIRLIGITNPPLETAHNWRQTTVTMVARNFLETESNIFYPRIDFAGEKSGITGMEFPFLNYLIYLCTLVFGYAHWYGRLINIIVSSFGFWYFFKILKKYFSEQQSFNATFLLLFSIWFNYSPKIMPDTFSVSLVLIGIYFGLKFLEEEDNFRNLFLFFVLALLGSLSKLPAGYLLVILSPFLFHKRILLRNKIKLIFSALIILFALSFYYFYWVPHLNRTFGFEHFFMGKPITTGAVEIGKHLSLTFERFYEDGLGYFGFLLFFAGVAIIIIKRKKLPLLILCITFPLFLIIMFKSGFTFYHHSYYMIPFAPVMALIASFGLGK